MKRIKEYINFQNALLFAILFLAILAQSFPLINVLNFEFSFIFSIILFLASGVLIIYYLRKFKSFGMLPAIILMKGKLFLILLFSPVIIAIFSNLLFHICPIGDGLLYYLVIVIPAFYFGIVMGAFSFWSNKNFAYLIFIVIFFLFAFAPLVEFYIYPQVYFYNTIVGIIPGTIYDEEILISGKLIFYRVLQILLFTVLIYSLQKVGNINRKNKRIFELSTFSGMLLFFLLKPYLGFSVSKYNLFQSLKGGVITPQIEIRYGSSLKNSEARFLAFKHIYFLKEIEEKTELSTPKNITSYIYKDANQKGALFGSKAANVAKPWMNEIYLDYNSLDATLEHELVHIFAAEIGSTPFKIASGFNMALLEGYAMAIEDNYSGYNIHYMALLAKKSGYNFNIPRLFSSLNFFGQTSSLSYIAAGSFVKFLIGKYGVKKVNRLYGDLDFIRYFGKDIQELEKEYLQFLNGLDYKINKETANLFFGSKPIIKKVCPRSMANQLKNAWSLFNKKDYYEAHNRFEKIFKYSNSFSALIGLIYCNNKLEYYKESLKLLSNMLPNLEGTSSYYPALLNLGDQLSLNKEIKVALGIYRKLAELAPTTGYVNLAKSRIELLLNGRLFNYLTGSDFDKYNILKSEISDKSVNYMLPILITLSERLNERSMNLLRFIDMLPTDVLSSSTAFEISKYLFNRMLFNDSLIYANLSIKKCSRNYRIEILKSHKKKVEWFLKSF